MGKNEMRDWLADQLGHVDVPQALWDHLRTKHYLSEALELEADGKARAGKQLLLDAARDQIKLSEHLGRPGAWGEPRPKTMKHKPDLTAYAVARAAAEAEAVALAAERDPRLRQFRARYLGGRVLSVPQARRLLASPAAGLLYAKAFEHLDIPVVGHRSWERARRENRDGHQLEVHVDLTIAWDECSREETVTWGGTDAVYETQPRLAFVDETGERFEVEVEVWALSVLDRLRELSERLATWYGWDTAEAAWFVLTDTPPLRDPLEAQITIRPYPALSGSRVTISVAPWMPADNVDKTFRAIQRDLLGKGHRQLTERNVALLRFVLAQKREAEQTVDGNGARLTWAQLMTRWNAEHPERQYTQERLFARDVNRARDPVLYPNYRLVDADEEEGTES